MPERPRLTPAIADLRRATRSALVDLPLVETPLVEPVETEPVETEPVETEPVDAGLDELDQRLSSLDELDQRLPGLDELDQRLPGLDELDQRPLVLVALSGGPDSLALAAALAFEAPRAGLRAGALIVDHGLQNGSADVAARAARQAEQLGLAPVRVLRVDVGATGGPEAAARSARYAALEGAASELDAAAVLLAHTLDDQAETVLLGLARGSGAASLQGMAAVRAMDSGFGTFRRPLLGIRRATTVQACADAGLEPWTDPQNADPAFMRVRVRQTVLPLLERELGPGVAEALARTAEQLREDAEALDTFAEELAEDLAEHAEAGISLDVPALAANPPALRQRLIRLAVASEFGVALSRAQTLEVARLVTDWHGQNGVDLPGVRVVRRDGRLVFESTGGEPDGTA